MQGPSWCVRFENKPAQGLDLLALVKNSEGKSYDIIVDGAKVGVLRGFAVVGGRLTAWASATSAEASGPVSVAVSGLAIVVSKNKIRSVYVE